MAAASLVVKISADINDFSKKLNALTKDVRKATDQMAEVGKSMTLGITVPVALASVALGKLGMENEAIANRMKRQFGPAVEEVNSQLHELMRVLPITHSELSNMAMGVNNTVRGLGLAATQSAKLSTALIGMAGNLAATTGTTIPDAMQALEQAMQGRTRGLKQFGIVIDEAAIKQEAYRLGILGINRELTPAGQALTTYSLLLRQAERWQGQATERMKDSEYQFDLLKRDLIEMAETIGNALVPAFRVLIGMGQALAKTIAETPPWLIKTTALLLAIAAAVGPLIFLFSKLIGIFFMLRTAVMLLMGPTALGGLLALLANPMVIAAVAAIAVALGGAIYLWKKYQAAQEAATKDVPDMPEMPSVAELMRGIGATDEASGDPLQNWKRGIDLVRAELERAVRVGDRWIDSYQKLDVIQKQALDGMMNNIGKTNEWAQAYAEVYDEVTKVMNVLQLMEVMQMKGANVQAALKRASSVETSDIQLNANVAQSAIQSETQLRLRERTIALANTFNASRVALLELAEAQRETSNTYQLELAKFKATWSNFRASLRTAGETFMTTLLAQFGPIGLLLKAFGEVLSGLQPFIDALFVPLAELGRVIGIMLTPILKILFIPLKYLAVVVALLGEVLARVSAGIATAIGRAIRGIGKAIDAIPGISAKGMIKAGEAMIEFGESQYAAADELKKARQAIMRLTFGQTQDSLDGLAGAADNASEALLNVPTGFKIALERFRAMLPGERAALPSTPSTPGGGGDDDDEAVPTISSARRAELFRQARALSGGNLTTLLRILEQLIRREQERLAAQTIALVVDGKTLAQVAVGALQKEAQRQFGNSTQWAEVQF